MEMNEVERMLQEVRKDDGWDPLDMEIPFWEPKPGDEIRGVCLGIRKIPTRMGDLQVMEVLTVDREKYLVKGHKALEKYFDRIHEGWGVWITYNGKAKSQNGTEYHSYTVKVKRLIQTTQIKKPGSGQVGLSELRSEEYDDKTVKALIDLTRAKHGNTHLSTVLRELEEIYIDGRVTEEEYHRIKEKLEA